MHRIRRVHCKPECASGTELRCFWIAKVCWPMLGRLDLDDSHFGEVLAVDDSDRAVLGVDDDEVVDAVALEGFEGLGCVGAALDRDRLGSHHVAGGYFQEIGVAKDEAPNVSVCHDAGERAIGLQQGDAARALGRHFREATAAVCAFREDGEPVVGAHDFVDFRREDSPEGAAGVEFGEVLAGDGVELEQDHGYGVADCHGAAGAGSGGEFERAGFPVGYVGEGGVAKSGEAGVWLRGDGDGLHVESLDHGKEAKQFRSFSAVAEGEYGVALAAQAEVPVESLHGVEESRWSSRRVQGTDQLLADVGVFSDSAEDDLVSSGQG